MGRFFFPSRSDSIDNDEQHPSASILSSDSSIDWISEFQEENPKVVTLTFHRSSTEQRLGVKLAKQINKEVVSGADENMLNQKSKDDVNNNTSEYVYVAALDEQQDSLLNPTTLPIRVGDLVVSFNDKLCNAMDLETLQEIMSTATGVITIRLICKANNSSSSADDYDDDPDAVVLGNIEGQEAERELIVQQAVFVQPKQHTCLPMDLDFESQIISHQRCLTFVNLNENHWLSPCCLEVGQIILAINGSCSYNLEEEDARFFLQTKFQLEPCVSITTLGYPNHASVNPDIMASTTKTSQSKNIDEIPILGKENETSESAPKQKQFSTMWSISGQKETEEEKRQREERQLDSKYIQAATLQIREMLREAKKDRSIDTAGKLPMFASCRKLFIAMKHRMDACTRDRGMGEVYFQLYLSLSKDFLSQYARILKSSLTAAAPTKSMSGSGTRLLKMVSPSSSLPSSFRNGTERCFGYDQKTADNEKNLCHIFNTSKFCVDTIEQMEETIQTTIDESYTSKVDMTSQQEDFDEMAAKAMEFLVTLLSNQLKGSAFADMTKLPWKKWDQVQDTNDYVYSICHQVESYISTAEGLLSPAYFCTLCDKLAMDIIDTFDSIMLLKCNQTTTTGKQQLLLDVHTLKSFFLGKLVEDHKKGALVSSWTIYEKMVSEKFQKMEALLRIASVSESDLKDFMDHDVI
mmetsp:Transcript_42660/g.103174  ORF Transcript_42660/g.103174 Transcript_42660/m.103174 type:complete len:693 (-) Transcript_42660:1083-3161(-)